LVGQDHGRDEKRLIEIIFGQLDLVGKVGDKTGESCLKTRLILSAMTFVNILKL
jgi:hypothetical protein